MEMKVLEFAVIGLGRFGTSIAKTLGDLGHEVLAIDIDEEKIQQIANTVTHAVVADVTNIDAMRAIGVRNVDVAVITMGGHMQASILGTMILKEIGIKKVVSKANDDIHGKVLAKIGADKVVYPERDTGIRLAYSLTSNNIIEQIDLDPNYSIVEMLAPANAVGKTLKSLDIRNRFGVYIMAIKSDSKMIVAPGANDVINSNDVVVLIGHNDDLEKFKKS